MPSKQQNPPLKPDNAVPSIARSIGFGAMCVAWWVLSIEIPYRDIAFVKNNNFVQLALSPVTEWAYGVTELWLDYRWLGIIIIILMVPLHYFLWTRRMNYDQYGKWLFKAGFMVFYVVTYGFFLLMFVGTELSLRFNPAGDI